MSNNLPRRMAEHRTGQSGFTSRYNMKVLVHYEVFRHTMEAIAREKQLKKWSHARKVTLIEMGNQNGDELVVQ